MYQKTGMWHPHPTCRRTITRRIAADPPLEGSGTSSSILMLEYAAPPAESLGTAATLSPSQSLVERMARGSPSPLLTPASHPQRDGGR